MEIKYGRKKSSIRKALREKLDEWIASTDDVDLQHLIKRDVIVTGGSIASMLLGKPVNDYDVYFKTKETTLAVAKYYVNWFNSLDRNVKVEVKEAQLKNCKGETEDRVVVYVPSAGVADASDAATPDIESGVKYVPVFLSTNAITLSNDVQIVIRFYGSPKEIHNNYDFAHAMSYYDYQKDVLEVPAEALECLLSRHLVYRGSLYPIASIFRMKKFLERGWRITAGQQLKIMWQISELNLKDREVLTEQLTGVDQAYLRMLIEALKEVDMDIVNSTYVATIIDRIFE